MNRREVDLKAGCVLAVLGNSIATIELGISAEHYWLGDVYIYDGGDGRFAMVGFHDKLVLAIFCDVEIYREMRAAGEANNSRKYLEPTPKIYQALVERCCGLFERAGIPFFTAAFWRDTEQLGDGNAFVGGEPWEVIWNHGASIIGRQLMTDLDRALSEWQKEFGLSDSLRELVRTVFLRRDTSESGGTILTDDELAQLTAIALTPENLEQGRLAMASIGIL